MLCVDSQDNVICVDNEAETEQARQQFEFSNTHRQASSNTNNGNQTVSDVICVDIARTLLYLLTMKQ